MIVLVCGGRDYQGDVSCLAQLHERHPITLLIHGGARGADTLAGEWAEARGIHTAVVKALWDYYGKKVAGPKRNRAMRSLMPQYVVAFPGGRGTADMVSLCNDIPVWRPYG